MPAKKSKRPHVLWGVEDGNGVLVMTFRKRSSAREALRRRQYGEAPFGTYLPHRLVRFEETPEKKKTKGARGRS